MKRLLFLAGLMLFLPLIASAQEAPKAEVFGGYSYFRADGQGGPSENLNGWNGSVVGNLNKWFGVKADFSGNYGNTTFAGITSHDSIYTYTVGPQVSYRKSERVTPFVHALFGGAHFRSNALGTTFTDNGFAMYLGGGVDVKLTKSLALRAFQTDYALDRVSGSNLNNFRFSTGLVFRFGTK
jgi:opacity protein-like surface antigen